MWVTKLRQTKVTNVLVGRYGYLIISHRVELNLLSDILLLWAVNPDEAVAVDGEDGDILLSDRGAVAAAAAATVAAAAVGTQLNSWQLVDGAVPDMPHLSIAIEIRLHWKVYCLQAGSGFFQLGVREVKQYRYR